MITMLKTIKQAMNRIKHCICQTCFYSRKKSSQTRLLDCHEPVWIILDNAAEDNIRAESIKAYTQNLETCGFLIGDIRDNQILITDSTGPGIRPSLSPMQCEPDYSVLLPYLATGKKVCGEWHLHLGYGSSLSSGDEYTLLSACKIIPGFTAIVANMKSPASMDLAAFSVKEGKIIKIGLETGQRYARTMQLIDPRKVAAKTLGILGLGSGGSHCAELLGRTGVQNFILVDLPSEKLEAVNLPRHIGFEKDIGKTKTRVTANILRMIDRKINVRAEHMDIAKDLEKLTRVISASDLILACPGDPLANSFINKVCIEQNKPAVFAGVFEKGTGGYVFKLDPLDGESACFSCLFGIVGLPDSNNVIRQAALNYGINESQLHAQQGLCLDTSQIALIQTRMALSILLKGTDSDLGNISSNLILIDNRKLKIRPMLVRKRPDCYVCNQEAWLASAPLNDTEKHKEPVIRSSIKTSL